MSVNKELYVLPVKMVRARSFGAGTEPFLVTRKEERRCEVIQAE